MALSVLWHWPIQESPVCNNSNSGHNSKNYVTKQKSKHIKTKSWVLRSVSVSRLPTIFSIKQNKQRQKQKGGFNAQNKASRERERGGVFCHMNMIYIVKSFETLSFIILKHYFFSSLPYLEVFQSIICVIPSPTVVQEAIEIVPFWSVLWKVIVFF